MMLTDTIITSLGLINFIALFSILLIGLPHGAFDGAIATYLGYTDRSTFLIRFLIIYILLSIIVVLLWLAFPSSSLIIFLGISIIHFGLGDARAKRGWFKWVQAIAHGGVVVAVTTQSHKSDVNKIFNYIIGGESSQIWVAIDVISVIVALTMIIYVWQVILDRCWLVGLIELIFLILLFNKLPPLVSFAIYFCCIHSVRHLWNIWRFIQTTLPSKIIYVQAIGFTITSWIVGYFAFSWCMTQMSVESSMLRVIFIGLSALTVPHMLLVDIFLRNHKEKL
jgi:Brp/Blh family beta-carotene 15,15'-monooxygenase